MSFQLGKIYIVQDGEQKEIGHIENVKILTSPNAEEDKVFVTKPLSFEISFSKAAVNLKALRLALHGPNKTKIRFVNIRKAKRLMYWKGE